MQILKYHIHLSICFLFIFNLVPTSHFPSNRQEIYTPQKINMEPENTPLQKEDHLPNHDFQVLC